MKTALKALFHSILVIGSVVALSNCGNSKNEDDSQTGTTVPRQKNAALSFTTLPATTLAKATNPAVISTTSVAKTVTTPLPSSPSLPSFTTLLATTTPQASTPSVIATTTSVAKTVTTPLPSIPKRRP